MAFCGTSDLAADINSLYTGSGTAQYQRPRSGTAECVNPAALPHAAAVGTASFPDSDTSCASACSNPGPVSDTDTGNSTYEHACSNTDTDPHVHACADADFGSACRSGNGNHHAFARFITAAGSDPATGSAGWCYAYRAAQCTTGRNSATCTNGSSACDPISDKCSSGYCNRRINAYSRNIAYG